MSATATDPHQPEDFRTKYSPLKPHQLWNYDNSPDVRRICTRMEAGRPARVAIYVGPPGSGKTLLAYQHGMWSSCERWRETPLWCAECGPCLTVLHRRWPHRINFFEIDGASPDAIKDIHNARYRAQPPEGYARATTSGGLWDPISTNIRPSTVLIDEAQHFGPRMQEELLKSLDRWHFANIILATTELERINSAIQSRAGNSIYRFDYPTIEAVTANLMRISALEHLPTTADAAEVIADVGDCQPRKCLDALQELTIVARHRNLHEISAAFVRDVLHIPTKGPSGDQPDIRGL